MSVRAYMLLDIVDRSCEDAVKMLRSRAEVMLADRLEGYPNIIAMVEAADKKSLVEAVMPVLGCIEGITEHLHLLVTRGNEISPDALALSNLISHKRKLKKTDTRKKMANSERR
jgi:tRNA-dihydrouridine synthase